MPFHVELKDGREAVRVFNLSEADVVARFIRPLRAGAPFVMQDQEFDPRHARLSVYEGRRLGPGELGPGGVGWANAVKRGADVTETFLMADTGGMTPSSTTLDASGRLRERILGRLAAGPFALADALVLTGDLLEGHRVSERLAVVEMAVWELLHGGVVALHPTADAPELAREDWERVVLDADTWLAPGPASPVIRRITTA